MAPQSHHRGLEHLPSRESDSETKATQPEGSDRPPGEEADDGLTPADDASSTPAEPTSLPSRRLRWLFRLIALALVPGLVVIVEVSLRVRDVGFPTGFALEAAADGEAVYEQNNKYGWRFFPPAIARRPVPFTLPAAKPADTYRVVVLGGSAAQGVPDHTYGFGRILEIQLRERFPDARIEFINAAMTAINSHVVLEIAKDCMTLEPDLFVVYVGNNEVVGPFGPDTVFSPFSSSLTAIRASLLAKRTRLGQWLTVGDEGSAQPSWGGMTMFLENQVRAGDARLQNVYDHFRKNLEDVCRLAQRNDVPIILSTVATNLKDCPPFATLHDPNLTEAQREEWDRLYDRGMSLEARAAHADAIESYLAAAELDDDHAVLHFRLGECYLAIKNNERAYHHFAEARDLDTLRFRADRQINAIIRDVAGEHDAADVELVDFDQLTREDSPQQIPGQELLYEHVHLNFRGNFLLGTAVFEKALSMLPESERAGADAGRPPLTESQCAERLAYTDWDRYRVAEQVLNVYMKKPPFTNQLDHEGRIAQFEATHLAPTRARDARGPDTARSRYERAIGTNASDPWLRYNYAALLSAIGDSAGAASQLRRVLTALPGFSSALNRLGMELIKQGSFEDGESYVRSALEIDPRNASLHTNLGVAFMMRGEHDRAVDAYQQALDIEPDYVKALIGLGNTYRTQGKVDEAIDCFEQVIQTEPKAAAEAHFNLGHILRGRGEIDQAIEHYRQATVARPTMAKAYVALGMMLQQAGRSCEALPQFSKAARLMPESPLPLDAVARILATHPDPAVRDPVRAIHIAESVAAMTKWRDGPFLDTLAAAYAAAGRFDDALGVAEMALGLVESGSRTQAAAIRERLNLYRQGKPYLEPAGR